ncbi:MAG TPA: DUF1707 domain-containing protein [Solirubrobacteraceae bacterium]|jgi:hypothetical protein|nr:DUF1707 domain-containing protein [Solirubrobacteraceae bacterium]
MSDPGQVRASDADREHAAEALREHFAAGRLSEDELGERIDSVYRATTVQELDRLRDDLPHLPASRQASRAEIAQRRAELRPQLLQRAGGALTPFVICTVIWAASGAGEFWPVWLLIFPVVFLVDNVWRLYGPAPELDRVQAELQRRSHHRHGHRGRRASRRELR